MIKWIEDDGIGVIGDLGQRYRAVQPTRPTAFFVQDVQVVPQLAENSPIRGAVACYQIVLDGRFAVASVKIERMANEIAAIWRKYYSQSPHSCGTQTNAGIGQYRPSQPSPQVSQIVYDSSVGCYRVLIYGIEVAFVRPQKMAYELAAVYVKYSNQIWRCA